jgi:hypothetical protein
VQRVFQGRDYAKRIEFRTITERPAPNSGKESA